MPCFAALDVSQETTAICVVDEDGTIVAEATVATSPDGITSFLRDKTPNLSRVGFETGPLAVWLWNALATRGLPVLCIDARHANAALKMRPVKTDRNDAAGLAQIMRVGWFKQVRIKSHDCYQVRSLHKLHDQASGRVPAGTYGADQTVPLNALLIKQVRGPLRSIRPPEANMRRSIEVDRGENHEPGARQGINQKT